MGRENRHHLWRVGGPRKTTALLLKSAIEICLATLYGSTRSLTRFFTSTLHRPESRHTTKCVQPSGGITKDSAHVAPDWPYPLRNRKSR